MAAAASASAATAAAPAATAEGSVEVDLDIAKPLADLERIIASHVANADSTFSEGGLEAFTLRASIIDAMKQLSRQLNGILKGLGDEGRRLEEQDSKVKNALREQLKAIGVIPNTEAPASTSASKPAPASGPAPASIPRGLTNSLSLRSGTVEVPGSGGLKVRALVLEAKKSIPISELCLKLPPGELCFHTHWAQFIVRLKDFLLFSGPGKVHMPPGKGKPLEYAPRILPCNRPDCNNSGGESDCQFLHSPVTHSKGEAREARGAREFLATQVCPVVPGGKEKTSLLWSNVKELQARVEVADYNELRLFFGQVARSVIMGLIVQQMVEHDPNYQAIIMAQ